jgi:hypothetical protein
VSGKDSQEFKDLLAAVEKFLGFLLDEHVDSPDFSVGDIVVAPFIVSTDFSHIFNAYLIPSSQTRIFLFTKNHIGLWSAPQGDFDVLEAFSQPHLAKFVKYHDKLANWAAVGGTVNSGMFQCA